MTPQQREAALRLTRAARDERDSFWKAEAATLLRELAAEPQGEPVAWAHPDGRVIPASTMDVARRDGGASLSSVSGYTVPLYAHPPQQRKPLSDEVIAKLINDEWATPDVPSAWNFARAIECAHGIGGDEWPTSSTT